MSNPASNAVEIYDLFIKEGGLDLDRYDQAVDEMLARELGLDPERSVRLQLEHANVTAEAFVQAFFRAIVPFAEMMADLLIFFERCGATQGRENIRIEFDFNTTSHLEFDLEHFKETLRFIRERLKPLVVYEWNQDILWPLCQVFRGDYKTIPRDPAAAKWYEETFDNRAIQELTVPPPRIEHKELRDRLSFLWHLVGAICEEGMRHAKNSREAFQPLSAQGDVWFDLRSGHRITGMELALVLSDRWPASIVKEAYNYVEKRERGDQNPDMLPPDAVVHEIDEIIARTPKQIRQVNEAIEQTLELLRLPVWRHRYDLYSAWVSTKIVEAAGPEFFQVHHEDGVLSYSFKATHLASSIDTVPPLFLMAEQRFPASNPIGKGRTAGIQPDYSICKEHISAGKTILVVESKQYLKASSTNFADAITDYAQTCSAAEIVLVNYGPASQSILDKVQAGLRGRAHIIGDFRPGRTEELLRFKQLVQSVLAAACGTLPDARRVFSSKGQIVTKLRWQERPADLDLYMVWTDGNSQQTINHAHQGDPEAHPWCYLDRDAQSGFGPERIFIGQLTKGTYHFAVHAYSDDAPLAGSGAVVELFQQGRLLEFQCPLEGNGRWWNLFRIDGASGNIEIINDISEIPRQIAMFFV